MNKRNLRWSLLCILLFSFSNYHTAFSQLTDHISYSQLFVIPGNAKNNDDCGKFYSYFNYKPIDKVKYRIVSGNTDNVFKIDEATGEISISNSQKLSPGKYTLMIRSVDGKYFETDSAIIQVIDAGKCIFIDPSSAESGNGTRENPYNTWDRVTSHKAGFAYFQKRNTTYGEDEILVKGIGTKDARIIIAAYGSGSRPVLDGSKMDNSKAAFWLGSVSSGARYVDIHSFVVHSSMGFTIERTCDHIRIFDCETYNCHDNAGIYLKYMETLEDRATKRYNEVYNCVSHDNINYHGIKANPGSLIKNCYVYNNGGNGISAFDASTIDHCFAYGNQSLGLEADGSDITIKNSRAERNWAGIYSNNASQVKVINNYTTNNSFGISFDYHTLNSVIESNISIANDIGIDICGGSSNIVIQKNTVNINARHGIAIYSNPDVPGIESNIKIYYNLVYKNGGRGISITDAKDVQVYNNTIINTLYTGSNTSGVLSKNNITLGISGNINSTNDLIYPDESLFMDFANNDFRLKPSAVNAIDKGLPVGLDSDISGNKLVNSPDIGAFEYVSETGSRNILEDLIIFPNPSYGRFSITAADYDLSSADYVQVLDLSGKLLYKDTHSSSADENSINMDISGISSGIYVVMVMLAGRIHLGRLIIQ